MILDNAYGSPPARALVTGPKLDHTRSRPGAQTPCNAQSLCTYIIGPRGALTVESGGLLKEAFGLNSYESKLYVALLGHGLRAAGAAQASGVPQSRTYDTLRSLEKKGFVTASDGIYRSVKPSAALGSRLALYVSEFDAEVASRRSAMKKIVDELEPLAETASGEDEPVMLRGLESISSAFLEVLSESDEVFLLVRKGIEAKAAFLGLLGQPGRGHRSVKLMLPAGRKIAKEELRQAADLGLELRWSEGIFLDMMAGNRGGVILGVPARGEDESFAAVAIWIRSRSFAASVLETLRPQRKAARPIRPAKL